MTTGRINQVTTIRSTSKGTSTPKLLAAGAFAWLEFIKKSSKEPIN